MTATLPPKDQGFNPARYALDNAVASARLEGLTPTPEFLQDCNALVAGALSSDDAIHLAKLRAQALDQQIQTASDLK